MPTVAPHQNPKTDLVIGAISGIVATVAMTVAAERMFRRLPRSERYPLPPREITEQVVRELDLPLDDDDALVAATLASHCAYGAATGVLYHAIRSPRLRRPEWTIAYAVFVWIASYLGWIPAAGILRMGTTHPARRNRLMIAAHVVFGAALYLSAALLQTAVRPLHKGPLRDA
jgi:hypothetical protein